MLRSQRRTQNLNTNSSKHSGVSIECPGNQFHISRMGDPGKDDVQSDDTQHETNHPRHEGETETILLKNIRKRARFNCLILKTKISILLSKRRHFWDTRPFWLALNIFTGLWRVKALLQGWLSNWVEMRVRVFQGWGHGVVMMIW